MILPALVLAAAAQSAPGVLVLEDGRQRVGISLVSGLPDAWERCAARCDEGPPQPRAGAGRLRFFVPGDPVGTVVLNTLGYTVAEKRDGDRVQLVLTARRPLDGRTLEQRYELDAGASLLKAVLQLPAGAQVTIAGGDGLVPEELPGLGGIYSNARAISVDDGVQETLSDHPDESVSGRALAPGDWAGVRGRFRALLARGDAPLLVGAAELPSDTPLVMLSAADPAATSLRLELYGGVVAGPELGAADPALAGMLYAVLWEPLRWLSFGLQWILDRWQDLVGRAWLAILLLSLTVKLLMAPLIVIAERWQAEVNRTRSLLEPELAAVRRQYRGEEAHHRTLAVYRRHGVSHFYTFKSLAGVLIQIPVFIAAFDMLGENFRLSGEGFLWVADLALPDRAAALPLALPYFGADLNLLPLVMTAFTVLAARWQEDVSLAPALRQGQRLRLYAMAGAFLLLLYTFPAGMVLYWTANNFWHLLRVSFDRFARRRAAS